MGVEGDALISAEAFNRSAACIMQLCKEFPIVGSSILQDEPLCNGSAVLWSVLIESMQAWLLIGNYVS